VAYVRPVRTGVGCDRGADRARDTEHIGSAHNGAELELLQVELSPESSSIGGQPALPV